MLNKLLFTLLLVFTLPLAHAGEAVPTTDDPVLEKRVMAVADKLRCLVCQNQTIADSHAELAIDLKNQVREKLRQGQSEQQVLDYMVARYGDFVLFQPQVKSTTWLLWFGPFVFLGLGFVVLIAMLRKRRQLIQQAPGLSSEEHARAASLLAGTDK
ncbi:MAG: cytochrome c-type biogenesis protein CcmH [Gallionellaceae bacterium]|nr:cytochrome c-type biogenesis protein CcmH [Gallionellaceae bacterium]